MRQLSAEMHDLLTAMNLGRSKPALLKLRIAKSVKSGPAVVVENNGIFAVLSTHHLKWPWINQGGNDFQAAYVELMQQLDAITLSGKYVEQEVLVEDYDTLIAKWLQDK